MITLLALERHQTRDSLLHKVRWQQSATYQNIIDTYIINVLKRWYAEATAVFHGYENDSTILRPAQRSKWIYPLSSMSVRKYFFERNRKLKQYFNSVPFNTTIRPPPSPPSLISPSPKWQPDHVEGLGNTIFLCISKVNTWIVLTN